MPWGGDFVSFFDPGATEKRPGGGILTDKISGPVVSPGGDVVTGQIDTCITRNAPKDRIDLSMQVFKSCRFF